MKRTAIYPGTFDPITNGHLDVLNRACLLFDKIIIAIAVNPAKKTLFSSEVRKQLIQENLPQDYDLDVMIFEGLTIDLARREGASALIRGLRAVSDFEYEFQMAQMNRHMDDSIETLFLMPSQDYFYTSSNLIKSVANFSLERVSLLVPANVLVALQNKFSQKECHE